MIEFHNSRKSQQDGEGDAGGFEISSDTTITTLACKVSGLCHSDHVLMFIDLENPRSPGFIPIDPLAVFVVVGS